MYIKSLTNDLSAVLPQAHKRVLRANGGTICPLSLFFLIRYSLFRNLFLLLRFYGAMPRHIPTLHGGPAEGGRCFMKHFSHVSTTICSSTDSGRDLDCVTVPRRVERVFAFFFLLFFHVNHEQARLQSISERRFAI